MENGKHIGDFADTVELCDLDGSVISKEMMEEEAKLEKESAEAEIKYEQDTDQGRFECFKKLLKHSEAYTEFLGNRMQTQVNLRRFERARKFNLMRAFKEKYLSKGIDCEKYMADEKVKRKEEHAEDPQSILNGEMLNVNGDVVPLYQPFVLVNAKLRPYQVDGVHWLKFLYENSVNGILADEMGLGKTIQCICTIAHLLEMGITGPFLVVAPLSTLPNWVNEFQRFTPLIPIVLYHGSMEQRLEIQKSIKKSKFLDLVTEPVIITSYEIVIKDHGFLEKFNFKFLVIDEGHRIKNPNCRLIRMLRRLNASNRLLLTGTPLQNNLAELWSLMNFTIPEVFKDLETFEKWLNPEEILDKDQYGKIIDQEQKNQVLETMHRILRPFLLRRVKSEVEIQLPPKKEILVYAPLSKLQEKYYKSTLDQTIRSMFYFEEEESLDLLPPRKRSKGDENCDPQNAPKSPRRCANENWENGKRSSSRLKEKSAPRKRVLKNDKLFGETNIKLTNPSMQLRKIVNHPYLIHYPVDPRTEEYVVDEELINNCGKLLAMDAMLKKLKEMGHKVLIFSQMTMLMDILGDYLSLRNYSYLRLDGTTSLSDRKELINTFNEGNTFLFLLSTRAGGLGINLTAADTVIIYDSDWNPQCDAQAMDRCHRIGQTKPVVVYRLVTAATIDEQIVKRATAKKKLEKLVIQTGKFKQKKGKVNGISIQELKELLDSNEHDVRIRPNGLVFSDEELVSLVDRSVLFQDKKIPEVNGGNASKIEKKTSSSDTNDDYYSNNHQKLYTVL